MARNCEKISISLHRDILEMVNEMGETENRKRSNVIETILRDYFDLGGRKKKPLARGIS